MQPQTLHLITKLELFPHKLRQLLTLTCNLIFLLELFPSNPRTPVICLFFD